MSRGGGGSVYQSHGGWYVAITAASRKHYRLSACHDEATARERGAAMASIAKRLKVAGRVVLVDALCLQAAAADARTFDRLQTIVDGLVAGTEQVADPIVSTPVSTRPRCPTVREFGELWTSNVLAHRYRRRVREIEHKDNVWRLEKHVYPIAYCGLPIGATRLDDFGLDHADHILAQPTLPGGSVRHVAQLVHRIFKLAVFPARLLEKSPFPPGWLPPANAERARSYLFPAEDLKLMRHCEIPLVKRLYIGLANREGPRRGNLVRLDWNGLLLDFADGAGYLTLDRTKNGRDANWTLDAGSAEALRRWRTLCPSRQWVFPASAVPASKRRKRIDTPMYVDHLGAQLREWLQEAGVTRAKLFQRSDERIPLRAHDLRATFVTLALANNRTEAWVMARTGHKTSIMLARYRRDATSIAELGLGWFTPLHLAIPELAALPAHAGSEDASRSSEAGRGAALRESRQRTKRSPNAYLALRFFRGCEHVRSPRACQRRDVGCGWSLETALIQERRKPMLSTVGTILSEQESRYESLEHEVRDWAAQNGVQIIDGQFIFTSDQHAALVAWLELLLDEDDEDDEEDEEEDNEEDEDEEDNEEDEDA